jgi:hypothetical protein
MLISFVSRYNYVLTSVPDGVRYGGLWVYILFRIENYGLHMHSLTREFEGFPDIVWQNLDQLYQMSRIVSYVGCKE